MEQIVKELQASAQDIDGVQMVPLHLALVAVQEVATINILDTVEGLQRDLLDAFEPQD